MTVSFVAEAGGSVTAYWIASFDDASLDNNGTGIDVAQNADGSVTFTLTSDIQGACSYLARAQLSADRQILSGAYSGGYCTSNSGTFSLQRQ